MHFINWGSESPEQLAIRRRIEEQALYEQAVRAAIQRAGKAPAVAGGGGNRTFDNTINEFVENDYVEDYFS